jgi:hypothetical protein
MKAVNRIGSIVGEIEARQKEKLEDGVPSCQSWSQSREGAPSQRRMGRTIQRQSSDISRRDHDHEGAVMSLAFQIEKDYLSYDVAFHSQESLEVIKPGPYSGTLSMHYGISLRSTTQWPICLLHD